MKVTIELDRLREVKYDFNAIADIEEVSGKGIGFLLREENMGINTIRLLIWAGLKHEDKKLTRSEVGDLLTDYLKAGGTWDELGKVISDAFEQSGIMGN